MFVRVFCCTVEAKSHADKNATNWGGFLKHDLIGDGITVNPSDWLIEFRDSSLKGEKWGVSEWVHSCSLHLCILMGYWHIWKPHAAFEFAAFSRQVSLLSPLQTLPMTLSRSAPLRHISRASSAAVCIASSADTRQRRRGRSIIKVSRKWW